MKNNLWTGMYGDDVMKMCAVFALVTLCERKHLDCMK